MKQPSPIFMTLAQASERSGISVAELNRARLRGKLPSSPLPGNSVRGSAVRIRAADLAAFTKGLPTGPEREAALKGRELGRRLAMRRLDVAVVLPLRCQRCAAATPCTGL